MNWLLSQNPRSIRWVSYLLLAGCAAILLVISHLPHGAVDRGVAIAVMVLMGLVLLLWSSFVLTFLLMPRVIEEARRQRAQKGTSNV